MRTEAIYRLLAVTILFTAFSLQTFSNFFIIVDYYTNTQQFAKSCVNKDKPWMHCNGKCQMMKMMQQEEKKDQNNPERKSENKNEVTVFAQAFSSSYTDACFTILIKKKLFPVFNIKIVDRSFDIFHPPQTI